MATSEWVGGIWIVWIHHIIKQLYRNNNVTDSSCFRYDCNQWPGIVVVLVVIPTVGSCQDHTTELDIAVVGYSKCILTYPRRPGTITREQVTVSTKISCTCQKCGWHHGSAFDENVTTIRPADGWASSTLNCDVAITLRIYARCSHDQKLIYHYKIELNLKRIYLE